MRWGLIARSETDRGLGIQTYEMYRNLLPDTTLVVIVPGSGFPSHPENYPDATQVKLRSEHGLGRLDEETVRDWWQGLDAIVSVETLYDWRLVEWAKADGVRTIVHGNPEFWMASNPQPDTWWWPTPWRLEHLPTGPVVPVPVPERKIVAAKPADGILRCLHIAGNNAMGDRNGTDTMVLAMRQVPRDALLSIYHQAPIARSHHTRVKTFKAVEDRWTMYENQHVLVLPRRYGGLCLPAIEAMASGLALVMPNCSPNGIWPILPVEGDAGRVLQMQTGPVETFAVYPNAIANAIKHLSNNRDSLAAHQARSREWAEANNWSALKDRYYDELEQ